MCQVLGYPSQKGWSGPESSCHHSPSCGLGPCSLPPLSCAAVVGVVRHGHYNFLRSHWEVLELGGSFGMGILSQGSLSLNLSLASGDPESLGGTLELSVVSVLWVQVLGHWHEQVTGCILLLVGRLGQRGRM